VRDIVCEFAERTIEQTYFFEFRTDIYIQLRLLSIELDPNQWHSGTHWKLPRDVFLSLASGRVRY